MEDYHKVWVSNPSTRTSSTAWEYFGFWQKIGPGGPAYIDKSKAVCKLCNYESNYTSNTTNLTNHLRSRHRNVVHGELKQRISLEPVLSPEPAFSPTTYFAETTPRLKQITDAIGEFIVSSLLPLSVIKSEGFRHLMDVCEPKFEIPEQEYFSDVVLPSMYNQASERVHADLATALDVALSIDIWSSGDDETFRTVSCNFVSSSWQLFSYVLNTKKITESIDGALLIKELETAKEDWHISHVSAVVSGNEQIADDTGTLSSRGWTHISCMGYIIHTAVTRVLALPDVDTFVRQARNLVMFFNENPMASSLLMQWQQQVAPEIGQPKLTQDVNTRWDSTLDFLERVLLLMPAARHVAEEQILGDSRLQSLVFSRTGEHILGGIVGLLKPMKEAAGVLCRNAVPTISLSLPTIVKLSRLLQPNASDAPLISRIKQSMSDNLQKQNTSVWCKNTLNLSSFVDPRFKALPFIDIGARRETHDLAVTLMTDLDAHQPSSQSREEPVYIVKEEPPDSPDTDIPFLSMEELNASSSADACPEPPRKKSKTQSAESCSLGDWFADVINPCEKSTELSSMERARQELDRYMAEHALSPNDDPMAWWKTRESAYPRLARLAKRILAIPASKTPLERVLSTTGVTVDKERARLDDPNMVDMLLFIKRNRNRELDSV